jgi:hypothetical protein
MKHTPKVVFVLVALLVLVILALILWVLRPSAAVDAAGEAAGEAAAEVLPSGDVAAPGSVAASRSKPLAPAIPLPAGPLSTAWQQLNELPGAHTVVCPLPDPNLVLDTEDWVAQWVRTDGVLVYAWVQTPEGSLRLPLVPDDTRGPRDTGKSDAPSMLRELALTWSTDAVTGTARCEVSGMVRVSGTVRGDYGPVESGAVFGPCGRASIEDGRFAFQAVPGRCELLVASNAVMDFGETRAFDHHFEAGRPHEIDLFLEGVRDPDRPKASTDDVDEFIDEAIDEADSMIRTMEKQATALEDRLDQTTERIALLGPRVAAPGASPLLVEAHAALLAEQDNVRTELQLKRDFILEFSEVVDTLEENLEE